MLFFLLVGVESIADARETPINRESNPQAAVEREPQFGPLMIEPLLAAPPIVTTYDIETEMAAWTEMAPFVSLLSRFPNITETVRRDDRPVLVFVPTLGAVVRFVDSLVQSVLNLIEMEAENQTTESKSSLAVLQRLGKFGASLPWQIWFDRKERNLNLNGTGLGHGRMYQHNKYHVGQWINMLNRSLEDTISILLTINATRDRLEKVVATHFVFGDFPEPFLGLPSSRVLRSLSGHSIDISSYPQRISVQNAQNQTLSPAITSRKYRQIQVQGGYIVVVADMVNPYTAHQIIGKNISRATDITLLPTVPPEILDTLTIQIAPISTYDPKEELQFQGIFDWLENEANKSSYEKWEPPVLPRIYPLFPFTSTTKLISLRKDCSIFYVLMTLATNVKSIIDEASKVRSLHMLVPNNEAFLNITQHFILDEYKKNGARQLPGTSDLAVNKIETNFKAIRSNSTKLEDFAYRLMELWKNATSLPPLRDVLLYHALNSSASIPQLRGTGPISTLSMDKKKSTIYISRNGIDDEDRGRAVAKPIGTFATLNGYVTVIDGLLTSFDLRVALSVLSAAIEGEDNSGEQKSGDESGTYFGPSCFPRDALVVLKCGQTVQMGALNAGDAIHTGENPSSTSKVFAFSHRDFNASSPDMVSILFGNRSRSITLSKNHYVYANGKLCAAGSVRTMDLLKLGNGRMARVDKVVHNVRKVGLFAPHSFHGDIVVNDVVVSTYTADFHPVIAHWILAPVRAFSVLFDVDEPIGSFFYDGGGIWMKWLPRGSLRY